MTELQAIRLCLRHRDPAGFAWLVKAYRREAYFHAMGLMGNAEDAADACQDAFRKAFEAMPALAQLDRFYPWFYRILRNHCLNLLARRQTAARERDAVAYDVSQRGETTPVAAGLEQAEDADRVRRAIDALKPEWREILHLKYYSERSYAEMATLLEIPRGTVMSRLYAARTAFRDAYLELEGKER